MIAPCCLHAIIALTLAGPVQTDARPANLEELRSRAAEQAYFADSPAILNELVKAGGKTAIPILEQLLRDEKTYWNNLGLNLDDADKIPAVRIERTLALLEHLATLGYRDRGHIVRDLRDQFRDHPLFQHETRVIEMAEALLSSR
jgi:hypothetical protein